LITPPLACTVRDCGLPLERNGRAYVCARKHAYDVSRSGYINLLQPQDRRSLSAGDSIAVVEARARLLDAGLGGTLVGTLIRRLTSWQLPDDAVIADLGSGSGHALAACVAVARTVIGIGIDLSTAAARHASRRFPDLTWVVANADRRLPLIDGRVSLFVSLHGRRNPVECARALTPAGLLLVAVPAADDLIELRTLVQGQRVERSRVDALVADHEPFFKPVEQFAAREQHALKHASLIDLLQTTYRGARTSAHQHIASLTTLDVTLASECVLFKRQSRRRPAISG
jgi:23S rRNA (guanine745-N1)-methyltransferase